MVELNKGVLCNKPICNVHHSAITLQWVFGTIQCMNATVHIQCDTIFHNTFFIFYDSLHSNSVVLPPSCLTDASRKSSNRSACKKGFFCLSMLLSLMCTLFKTTRLICAILSPFYFMSICSDAGSSFQMTKAVMV